MKHRECHICQFASAIVSKALEGDVHSQSWLLIRTPPAHNQALWILLAEEDMAWYVKLRAQLGSRLLHRKLLLLHLQQEQRKEVCMRE